jgi:hypothetical protein
MHDVRGGQISKDNMNIEQYRKPSVCGVIIACLNAHYWQIQTFSKGKWFDALKFKTEKPFDVAKNRSSADQAEAT